MRGSNIFEDLLERCSKIINFSEGWLKNFLIALLLAGPFNQMTFEEVDFFCTEACPFSPIYIMVQTVLEN